MNKVYCGIDVGTIGFLAVNDNGNWSYMGFKDSSIRDISDKMREVKETSKGNLFCVIEDVHAIYGSSSKATFNFGMQKGIMLALLEANSIPYALVAPKEWQKEMWDNKDLVVINEAYTNKKGRTIIKKKKNTKKTSENAAKRLFPDADFKRTPRCTKNDDNKIDAMLMAEYGRRKNL